MNGDCPLCRAESEPLFESHGYWVHACSICGHRFAAVENESDHVAKVYGDHYFRDGGAGYPDYLAEGVILRAHGRRYGRLLQKFTKTGTLLDVGTAAGFVLAGLFDCGWKGCGIEPNALMASYAREKLGLCVVAGTVEEYRTDVRFDVVSFIQVIAHLRDPLAALEQAASLTREEGFWLIETWDRESWTARLAGRRWHEYSPPSVLHFFSADGLAGLAGRLGFREVARGRPAKRVSGAHAKSLLKYKLERSALGRIAKGALKVLPDGLTIPYPAEDLFWMLFQRRA